MDCRWGLQVQSSFQGTHWRRAKGPTLLPSAQLCATPYCTDSGEDKEERPTLPTVAITTLQRSSRFKNLFDQLELTANEWRIVIEALLSIASKAVVSIVSRARVEYLAAEVRADKAFLQDTNKITFSDEDMEIGYSSHRRPLYLVASIN